MTRGVHEGQGGQQRGKYQGPECVLSVQDLGIAVGSAAKTAQLHNVDNRVMYRPAVIAIELGMAGRGIALAIPLSATGRARSSTGRERGTQGKLVGSVAEPMSCPFE